MAARNLARVKSKAASPGKCLLSTRIYCARLRQRAVPLPEAGRVKPGEELIPLILVILVDVY
jgi:hypothetical protein